MPKTLSSKLSIMNQLIHADCLDAMQEIADKSIDLVVTSPPYNMRTRIRNGEYTEREKSDHFSKKYDTFHDAYPIDTYYEIHKRAINEMLRISKLVFINIQIVTGSKEAWFRLIGEFATKIRDIIIWDKGNGQPAMHGSVINKGSELILAMESSAIAGRAFDTSYFERGKMQDIWRLGRGDSSFDGHNAVFPLSLPTMIISNWTKPDDIVCDPFAGVMTTAIACINLKRRYICIEKDKDIFDRGAQRVNDRLNQMELEL